MKVRALVEPHLGTNDAQYYWRVDKPFEYLRKYGIDADVLSIDNEEFPSDTNIVIIPKLRVKDVSSRNDFQNILNVFRECGTKIVYDVDDDMWSPASIGYRTKLSIQNTEYENDPLAVKRVLDIISAQCENDIWTIQQCDAVTVANKQLKDYLEQSVFNELNIPVFIVPNAIDVSAFENSLLIDKDFRQPNYTLIGWAGGLRVQKDVENMLSAWNIIAENNSTVQFWISGWLPDLSKYENLVIDQNVVHLPWESVETYGNNMQVDIGCVCVEDSDFARRKSTQKAWEFALANAMVIGSKNLYDVEPIPICETVEDWVKTLKWYIVNYEDRERVRDSYKQHVKNQYDMQFNWLYWADAYSKIINTVKIRKDVGVSSV